MRQRKQNIQATPANDNQGTPHVYVPDCTLRKDCGPHVYVPKTRKGAARKGGQRFLITTSLPQILPILPDEIALIRGTMADLLCQILANDNEPD